ncbi:MAG: PAS domain S-box protein [Deltaproteobacteria bacterium]|nr:MAG: PAS domain S-box protein [Deltaproteobacteria bacterium]
MLDAVTDPSELRTDDPLAGFGPHAPFAREVPDAVSLHRANGRFLAANRPTLEILGRPWAELRGRRVFEFLHPQDRDAVVGLLRRSARRVTVFPPHRLLRGDGTTVWVEVRVRYLEGDQVLAVLRDVSDRIAAERALAESEHRHRSLVEHSPLGVLIFAGGKIAYANPAVAEILGRSPDELVALAPPQVAALVHEADRAMVFSRIQARLVGDTAAPNAYGFRIVRPDGTLRHLEVYSSRVEYDGATAAQTVVVDVTDRIHAQRQLAYAQKMEAVGRLAGGIAHDFNNLLTVVMNEADMLQHHARLDPDSTASLEAVLDAARRASRLTEQLLAFARRKVRKRVPVVIDDAIVALLPLLRRMVGRAVRIDADLRAEDAAVVCDPTELEQVLVNLVLNARDAMQEGTIRIATHVRRKGSARFVGLQVMDDGPGMPPEVARRCFEPFFTTRAEHGGSGLGLATCYAIVDELEGRIDVSSEVGVGTTFEIELPAAAATPQEDVPVAADAAADRRILLVEDEAAVRRALATALGRAGFDVHEASSAEAALEIWNRSGPFRALVTDIMMPGENGFELAERLVAHAPDLEVVLISGYAEDPEVRAAIERSAFAFFAKPFLARTLVDHLEARLGDLRDGAAAET